ncbi:DNA-processing protein DprA [Saccharopolyspora sp. CA-218241]|uniref:DNA-processing protein DprA n=1 Tax=Saccharopolyspora sp. CA-218241 TaxID=3240027 RepID=UPI003D95FAED
MSTRTEREELLVARAYLSAVAEPPAPALTEFVAARGPRRAAEEIKRGGVPPPLADVVEARREHVDGAALLDAGRRVGARLVVPEDPDWPGELVECLAGARTVGLAGMAEPVALWVRGSAPPDVALANAVAVVGARAASGYGEHVAAELAHGVARSGFTVVSGAAYGIDGAAHRGALAAGGSTVAFLACGVDVDYPAGHGRLLKVIAQQGLVASEHPPGTPPRKHRFLVRNRLIAAAGQATVVVEAGARSGAGNTAHTADALGKPVLAVPGPVTSKTSVGCHDLVRTGTAVLATGAHDVLELLQPLGQADAAPATDTRRRTDALHPHARRVHDALSGCDGSGVDALARECGLPLRTVRALLPELELSGLAVRTEAGWSATT